MSTSNALKRLSSCFIAMPKYLHVTEITWVKQGRHFSKFVGGFLEKDEEEISRLYSVVVIHVRVRAF